MLNFSRFSRYCQTLTTVKGFSRVYNHIQTTYPYPYPNSTIFIPQHSLFTSKYDRNNNYDVAIISHKQPSPVSILTTTTQVDTNSNNDDNKQYISTTRKHNHSTPEITEITTATTPVQATVNTILLETSSSTLTKSLKIPPSRK